jgi:hypothetical protein
VQYTPFLTYSKHYPGETLVVNDFHSGLMICDNRLSGWTFKKDAPIALLLDAGTHCVPVLKKSLEALHFGSVDPVVSR